MGRMPVTKLIKIAMNDLKEYLPFYNFILRTPLFPLSLTKNLVSSEHVSDKEIKSFCTNPVISEALYIASPPLFYEVQKWIKGQSGNSKKEFKKAERLKESLIRYFFRMSTRCTPFGLFAGITTGKIAKNTKIKLQSLEKNISHTRLDMNYLCALAMDLSKTEIIKNKILFYPNSSIYSIGHQLRYVEYEYVNSR